MDQVLGRNVGNALEVAEALAFLKNDNPDPRLREVVLALAREMLDLAGLSADPAAALDSGRALEVFAHMIHVLGGPADLAENSILYLPIAAVVKPCLAHQSGAVRTMDTRRIGVAVLAMGGGRRDAADDINPSVGLSDVCNVGNRVEVGQPLAMVHAASEADANAAIAEIRSAISIGERAAAKPVILEQVAGPGSGA
jgi:thymidine phosphorylase